MSTFYIRTEGPKGPRGGRGQWQAFVVLADSEAQAREKVLACDRCEPGTLVTHAEQVTDITRVQAC